MDVGEVGEAALVSYSTPAEPQLAQRAQRGLRALEVHKEVHPLVEEGYPQAQGQARLQLPSYVQKPPPICVIIPYDADQP
mmetsp:Transcript_19589/g.42820  ORF Transcript_19589/g.42820 Transcript_19589/m.42820 type:complete len:80 (-) Transcript_19589:400-639(-)